MRTYLAFVYRKNLCDISYTTIRAKTLEHANAICPFYMSKDKGITDMYILHPTKVKHLKAALDRCLDI